MLSYLRVSRMCRWRVKSLGMSRSNREENTSAPSRLPMRPSTSWTPGSGIPLGARQGRGSWSYSNAASQEVPRRAIGRRPWQNPSQTPRTSSKLLRVGCKPRGIAVADIDRLLSSTVLVVISWVEVVDETVSRLGGLVNIPQAGLLSVARQLRVAVADAADCNARPDYEGRRVLNVTELVGTIERLGGTD